MSHRPSTLAALALALALGSPAAAGGRISLEQARRDLAGADAQAAVEAARALGRHKGAAASDALLDALALGLAPEVAAAALAALAAHRDPRALEIAAAYARHRAPEVRAAAVGAVGALGDARADEPVIAALSDGDAAVRAAAIAGAGERRLAKAIPALVTLLKGGDPRTASALARLADVELARQLAELIGQAPDALLARCLGEIALRRDFGPEEARVEVIRALGKLPGAAAGEQLARYVAATPAAPPRPSRREAEALLERLATDGSSR